MILNKIMYTLFLLFIFWNQTVLSDESKSDFTDFYGKVDSVYHDSSRLVISDMNLHFTHGSSFYNKSGARIYNIGKELSVGKPVKFHFYKNTSGLRVLKSLRIISDKDYQRSMNLGAR